MASFRAAGPFRHFLARPRLLLSMAIGVVVYWLTPGEFDPPLKAMISWNIAVVTFLSMAAVVMARATDASMRKNAQELDEGRYTVLVLAMVAATASLAAIGFELFRFRMQEGGVAILSMGLSATTIITAWSFIQVIFAEHYAHEYYAPRRGRASEDEGGLKFPGGGRPDYLDFLYFSFTIGVANQTADTSVVSRGMRLLVLVHSIISYFFNTIVLALTINIAANLLGS